MNHEIVGGIVNALPIEKMVAAPLVAAVKAQSEMSLMLAHYIQDVGMDGDGNMRMVTLKYDETVANSADPTKTETKTRYTQAPFLAMTGLPNLAVESADIAFDLEVKTAEEEVNKNQEDANVTTDYKSWWSPVTAKFTGTVTHSSQQTRSTDTRAKYTFNVSARKQGTPEAFLRIIDAVTNSVANPTASEPKQKKLIDDKNSGGGNKPSGGGEQS